MENPVLPEHSNPSLDQMLMMYGGESGKNVMAGWMDKN